MRTLRFAFLATITAIVVAFGGIGSGRVQAVTRPFASGFQVQNLSSTDADITITLYNEDGTTAATAQDTVPGSGQVTYATLDQLPDAPATGFTGSAVISSSERVAAIVNLVSPDIGLSFGGEAYIGFDAGAQSVRLPLLFKASNGFSTFFNVQNVGDATANVTVTYQNGATETATIAPGAAKRFDQDNNSNLPSGFAGSATVTSDQDIVAAVVQVGPTTVLAYNGFTQTSQTPYFPLINANNSGFITGISLQNAGDQSTNVTVTYTPSGGGTNGCAETQTIPAGEARFYAVSAFANDTNGDNCANGATFVGSAQVTANSASQPLVGIVNQLNQSVNKGGSYGAFDPSAATSTVVYPLIQDRVFGYFTGTSIVNVGSSATTVTCSYSNSSVTQSETLDPGETFTATQTNAIASGYNGSGTCQASGSGQIIGIANQLLFAGTRDTFFVYEGINN